MNKDTFYFPHDYNAASDEKIEELLFKMGNEGYGIYWRIVEMLYQNNNSLRTNYERIAYSMRSHSDCIASVVESFGLFEISDGFFSCKRVQKNLDLRNERSEKAKESANRRWNKPLKNKDKKETEMPTHSTDDANALRAQCEPNAKKERKGKESIKKEVSNDTSQKGGKPPNAPASGACKKNSESSKPDDVTEDTWQAWLNVRQSKRAGKVSDRVLALVKAEADRAQISMEDALSECALRGWAGFKADWYTSSTGEQGSWMNAPTSQQLKQKIAAEFG